MSTSVLTPRTQEIRRLRRLHRLATLDAAPQERATLAAIPDLVATGAMTVRDAHDAVATLRRTQGDRRATAKALRATRPEELAA